MKHFKANHLCHLSFQQSGRKCVVVGATYGIGRSTADILAARGAHVNRSLRNMLVSICMTIYLLPLCLFFLLVDLPSESPPPCNIEAALVAAPEKNGLFDGAAFGSYAPTLLAPPPMFE